MADRIPIDILCDSKISSLSPSFCGLIDYVDISSVDNNEKRIIAVQTMNADEAPSRAKQLLKKDDVLVSTVRPNLNAVALVDTESQNILVGSTGYCVLRCKGDLDKNYLFNFCQSPYFIDDMTSQATGASYPAVNAKIVRNSLIPYYPLETQKQIAATLDKVTDLINKRKQQLEKLDELVKSRFIEMFGDTSDKEKVTMADICKIITDGTHQPPKFTPTGIPFLFVSNIVTNEISYNSEKFISAETYTELVKRTPIAIGDILLSTVGSYGHPAVVKSDQMFCFQRHIAYLKPNIDMVNSEYLRGAILSSDVQRQIDESVKGIAQKTLNLSEIRKLRLPLPPMELQEQFAAFVEATDKLKFEAKQGLEKLETLKKSLMQEYFG